MTSFLAHELKTLADDLMFESCKQVGDGSGVSREGAPVEWTGSVDQTGRKLCRWDSTLVWIFYPEQNSNITPNRLVLSL